MGLRFFFPCDAWTNLSFFAPFVEREGMIQGTAVTTRICKNPYRVQSAGGFLGNWETIFSSVLPILFLPMLLLRWPSCLFPLFVSITGVCQWKDGGEGDKEDYTVSKLSSCALFSRKKVCLSSIKIIFHFDFWRSEGIEGVLYVVRWSRTLRKCGAGQMSLLGLTMNCGHGCWYFQECKSLEGGGWLWHLEFLELSVTNPAYLEFFVVRFLCRD